MFNEFGISEELENKAKICEKSLKEIFEKIDEDALYNSQKVLMSFQKNRVSPVHFESSTGYGEGDIRQRLHRENLCRGIRCRGCIS